jgi:hypothetical protein
MFYPWHPATVMLREGWTMAKRELARTRRKASSVKEVTYEGQTI